MKLHRHFFPRPSNPMPLLLEVDNKLFLTTIVSNLSKKSVTLLSFAELLFQNYDIKSFDIKYYYCKQHMFVLFGKKQFVVFKSDDDLFVSLFQSKLNVIFETDFTSVDVYDNKDKDIIFFVKNKRLLEYNSKFELREININFDEDYLPIPLFRKDNVFIRYNNKESNSFTAFSTIYLRGEFIEVIKYENEIQIYDDNVITNIYTANMIDKIENDDLKQVFESWLSNLNDSNIYPMFFRIKTAKGIMIDSDLFKNPVPNKNILFHCGIFYYKYNESTLFMMEINSKMLCIKPKLNSEYIFSNVIYPLEFKNTNDEVLSYNDGVIEGNIKNLKTKLSPEQNHTIFYDDHTFKGIHYGRQNGFNAKLTNKIDEIEYFVVNFGSIAFIRRKNIILVMLIGFKNINSIFEHDLKDQIYTKWCSEIKNKIQEQFDKTKFATVFDNLTPRQLMVIDNSHNGSYLVNMYSSNTNASGDGVLRLIKSKINDFIMKNFLISRNIWPGIKEDILIVNDLFNFFVYVLSATNYWGTLSFRVPVQFLVRIGKLLEIKDTDIESQLLYFLKYDDEKKYKEVLTNDPSIFGHETRLDVLKDCLHFNKEVDSYLDQYEKIFREMINKLFINNTVFPNLQTLDYFLSGIISLTTMREQFMNQLHFKNFDKKQENKFKKIVEELSDDQFEKFIFNISGSNRISETIYKITCSNSRDSVGFITCDFHCIIPLTVLRMDNQIIVGFLTNEIIEISDEKSIIDGDENSDITFAQFLSFMTREYLNDIDSETGSDAGSDAGSEVGSIVQNVRINQRIDDSDSESIQDENVNINSYIDDID